MILSITRGIRHQPKQAVIICTWVTPQTPGVAGGPAPTAKALAENLQESAAARVFVCTPFRPDHMDQFHWAKKGKKDWGSIFIDGHEHPLSVRSGSAAGVRGPVTFALGTPGLFRSENPYKELDLFPEMVFFAKAALRLIQAYYDKLQQNPLGSIPVVVDLDWLTAILTWELTRGTLGHLNLPVVHCGFDPANLGLYSLPYAGRLHSGIANDFLLANARTPELSLYRLPQDLAAEGIFPNYHWADLRDSNQPSPAQISSLATQTLTLATESGLTPLHKIGQATEYAGLALALRGAPELQALVIRAARVGNLEELSLVPSTACGPLLQEIDNIPLPELAELRALLAQLRAGNLPAPQFEFMQSTDPRLQATAATQANTTPPDLPRLVCVTTAGGAAMHHYQNNSQPAALGILPMDILPGLTPLACRAADIKQAQEERNQKIPWIIVTADPERIRSFLISQQYFGLQPEQVFLFADILPRVPAINHLGRLIKIKHRLDWCSQGHGQVLAALFQSGILAQLPDGADLFITGARNLSPLSGSALTQYRHNVLGQTITFEVVASEDNHQQAGVAVITQEGPKLIPYPQLSAPQQRAAQEQKAPFFTGTCWVKMASLLAGENGSTLLPAPLPRMERSRQSGGEVFRRWLPIEGLTFKLRSQLILVDPKRHIHPFADNYQKKLLRQYALSTR